MDRKEFLKASCGICVALSSGFILSAVMDSCKTPMSVYKTEAQNDIVKVPLKEFAENNFKMIRVHNFDYDLAVQKNADNSFTVLVLRCTHAGHPLTKTGQNYYCTLHGSQFDHFGQVTKGPADKNLLTLHTNTDKDNLLINLKS